MFSRYSVLTIGLSWLSYPNVRNRNEKAIPAYISKGTKTIMHKQLQGSWASKYTPGFLDYRKKEILNKILWPVQFAPGYLGIGQIR